MTKLFLILTLVSNGHHVKVYKKDIWEAIMGHQVITAKNGVTYTCDTTLIWFRDKAPICVKEPVGITRSWEILK